MKTDRKTWLGLWGMVIITSIFLFAPNLAAAAIPDVYTNDNFWTSEHDVPVSFVQDRLGNFSGTTATGKTFTQTIVANPLSIRLHKFSIDQAFFYISDRGVIKADSDIAALSIYMTLG